MRLLLFLFVYTAFASATAQIVPFEPAGSLAAAPQIEELQKDLQHKRIVFLGDIVHGEANIDSLRGVIADYLISQHGFNTLAFESGIYDLFIADQALADGQDVNQLLRETIYDVWGGPSLQSLAETIEKHRKSLRLIGFDPKFSGIHSDDIDIELEKVLERRGLVYSQSQLEDFQKYCGGLTSWDTQDIDADRFSQIGYELVQLLKPSHDNPEEETAVWLQILKNIKALYDFLEIEGVANLAREDWKASTGNTRDSLMAANLKFYLDLYPDAKIICWGASGHFARSTTTISNPAYRTFTPMGSYFGDEALIIGAMGHTGAFGWSGNVRPMPELPPNSVEAQFSAQGIPSALVDLEFLAGKEPLYSSVFVEAEPATAQWDQLFDWVIFVDRVIPKTMAHHTTEKHLRPRKPTETRQTPSYFLPAQTRRSLRIMKNEGTLIEGIIQDDLGEPIAYSSVALKGTSYGAISDVNGVFSIRVPNPESDTLLFSNVAYQQVELALRSRDDPPVTITLPNKLIDLPEIIISPNKTPAEEIVSKAI